MRLSWPGLTQTPAAGAGPRGAAMTTQQPPEPPPNPPPDLPEIESEMDESEMRRELLNDVSACRFKRERGVPGSQAVPACPLGMRCRIRKLTLL
jgi:hypothetical protein